MTKAHSAKRRARKPKKNLYHVELLANFKTEAYSPAEIRSRVKKALKEQGFNKGWEILIKRET